MHGNVFEWCLETWANPVNSTLPQDAPVDVASPGASRVVRGGGWSFFAQHCRSAFRNHYAPAYSIYDSGFRLAAGAVD
jgi:formylglycine-generating enzyme required for sulfatase activity